ncbi:Malto-oligosyltrehalose synthase [Richelia intracellularis HH01]|uniref:Malto-oligosyltrehalose synthase n=1 Tax=Richelia intracellularis HH01 TaxID=1165094 RepID=M1X058_9NOST|nr:malto-oligosyltrehalose synthase [Richelia intracellularis]CCH68122.1 Malto-oligosyltrehalose synthase [Richelia intracellularis HH01]
MQIPVATYRLQFNPNFVFQHSHKIVAYLAEMGISHIYASPILTARQNSSHGYDTVNPNEINPELGGIENFLQLRQILKNYHMEWIQDIVPNHMAFDSQNHMLMDVLENGPHSQYRNFFDIDWNHPYEVIRGRVLAPFLGEFYGYCLESGKLILRYEENGLTINYYSWKFPIRIESYDRVLTYNLSALRETLGRDNPHLIKLMGVLYMLKHIPSGEEGRERYDQISFIKRMLWEIWNDSQDVQNHITANICIFNGEYGNPESFNFLESLLAEQFFCLSYWKVGNEELNYRRFFTVNDLICLRVEEKKVFEKTHQLIFQLVKENRLNGLRIDHIDGLYDPTQYVNRLREHAPEAYLVVEKILGRRELLPINWPIQGTSGYDFLAQVNYLFCNLDNEQEFDDIYQSFLGRTVNYQDIIDQNKRLIISKYLAGDIDNLANLLKQICINYRYASDFTIYGLKAALVEIMALFPVYRTYINSTEASKSDQEYIQKVINQAKSNIPNFLNEVAFIEKFLLLDFDEFLTEENREQWLHFLMRLQQFTGPLMAKGVEDTTEYVYNRLISLNEVGSHPDCFGISQEDFHHFNQTRFAQWPHSMNATSTHDTKRGEDVRARINILSEIPKEWEKNLKRWHAINKPQKNVTGGIDVPTPNDEYFLYQTLIGTFPWHEHEYPQFVDRIKEYIIKAIREAKVHTAWLKPDADYENNFTEFAEQILKPDNNEFLDLFRAFQKKIAFYGVFNSLSQTLLKITAPGLPDFYQGTELWDFSLVDPDNRRPVDFQLRQQYLENIKIQIDMDLPNFIAQLLQYPESGEIKQFLIYQVLSARKQYLEVFQRGTYHKLTIAGSLKGHIIAFSRKLGEQNTIVVVPRFITSLIKEGEYPIGKQVWQETRIISPTVSKPVWHNLITKQQVPSGDIIWLRDILQSFPVALLVN